MNMPMLKEGADWPGRAIAGVVGIIASGIVAIMVNGYNSQGANIANQQRERDELHHACQEHHRRIAGQWQRDARPDRCSAGSRRAVRCGI